MQVTNAVLGKCLICRLFADKSSVTAKGRVNDSLATQSGIRPSAVGRQTSTVSMAEIALMCSTARC